jgi:hypothetical protein
VGLLVSSLLIGILTSCVALASPDSVRVPSEPPADAYLRAKLALWRDRLKLQDWSVSVIASPQSELRPGTLGNIHWNLEMKTAIIRVLTSDDGHPPTPQELLNMEGTIVHELIHLELAALPKTDDSKMKEEFAVDHLADALLELDRKEQSARALP